MLKCLLGETFYFSCTNFSFFNIVLNSENLFQQENKEKERIVKEYIYLDQGIINRMRNISLKKK